MEKTKTKQMLTSFTPCTHPVPQTLSIEKIIANVIINLGNREKNVNDLKLSKLN